MDGTQLDFAHEIFRQFESCFHSPIFLVSQLSVKAALWPEPCQRKTRSRMPRSTGLSAAKARSAATRMRTRISKETSAMTKTKNALKILERMVGDDAELQQMIAEETVNAAV